MSKTTWSGGQYATLFLFIGAVFFLLTFTIASDCNVRQACLSDQTADECNELDTFWK